MDPKIEAVRQLLIEHFPQWDISIHLEAAVVHKFRLINGHSIKQLAISHEYVSDHNQENLISALSNRGVITRLSALPEGRKLTVTENSITETIL